MRKLYALKQDDGLVMLYRGVGSAVYNGQVRYYGVGYVTFISYYDGLIENGYIWEDKVYQLELIGPPNAD